MTHIPLIYFGCLSLILYRRNKQFDIATIISLMFAVSGIFTILIDINGYRSNETIGYHISAIPATLYCILVTLCILPLSRCNIFNRINLAPIGNVKLLKFISVVALIWFLLTVYFARSTFQFILASDMADIRTDLYRGIQLESWMASLPAPIRLIFALFNMIFGCPWILIFLGFYSMIGERIPMRYSYFLLIASLSGPFNGILRVDRSASAYWIIAAITLFFLFRKQLPSKAKKHIYILGIVALTGIIAYLSAMTTARFGTRDAVGNEMGSLIEYFGQSYINFCYFFDNYQLPFHHFGIIFPFTSEYIFGEPSGGVVIQKEMTRLSYMNTGVFYTFIGHMIIGIGQCWAVTMALVYAFFSSAVLRRINRRKNVDTLSLYLYFASASVILLGLFGHYYASAATTFSVVAMYFLIKMLRNSVYSHRS